jgi:hypothetical protein
MSASESLDWKPCVKPTGRKPRRRSADSRWKWNARNYACRGCFQHKQVPKIHLILKTDRKSLQIHAASPTFRNEKATMKDFFISYTQSDLARARWINDLLEAAGYTTVAQFKNMPPGSNFVIEMDEAVKQARQTIAVLSPEYLASDYCQQELAAAIRSDPKGKKRLLIPVRI